MLFKRKTDGFLKDFINEKREAIDYLADKKLGFYKSQMGNIDKLCSSDAKIISEGLDYCTYDQVKSYIDSETNKKIEKEVNIIKSHKEDVENFIKQIHKKSRSNKNTERNFDEITSYLNNELDASELRDKSKNIIWDELNGNGKDNFISKHMMTMFIYKTKNPKMVLPKFSETYEKMKEETVSESFGVFSQNYMDL